MATKSTKIEGLYEAFKKAEANPEEIVQLLGDFLSTSSLEEYVNISINQDTNNWIIVSYLITQVHATLVSKLISLMEDSDEIRGTFVDAGLVSIETEEEDDGKVSHYFHFDIGLGDSLIETTGKTTAIEPSQSVH